MRPHLDHEHLLRTTLRTNEPPMIILPDLCHITSLIVDDAHRRCFHQGTRTTLALLAAEYMVRRRTVLRALPPSTRWLYIPEAVPWWGGFWERLVASVKSSLKINLHPCYLNIDELLPTFYELALHLNMRLLIMDDGGSALTSAHFVFGVTSIRGIVSPAVDTSVTVDRAWWNKIRVSSHLTKRWTREYLHILRNWSRSPRGRSTRTLRVGEIVLVHGESSRGQ
ncbi:hypothetical protein E2C01_050481 [Portunus trituberculatus]|uniref:DUF5641 domain-containing protein n=1 Tax=Portunus trituberculatus TaxID=210409 RepID=A0A5B7GG89_PORTR|nr:hypothetical protein [Portunus trituberculatus]